MIYADAEMERVKDEKDNPPIVSQGSEWTLLPNFALDLTNNLDQKI